ncbi:uncharacterized protein LOC124373673 [Homalodisca vitripennis]|uniref:uncharacterized protein LOC124373673 n=1 Tax=Homalodisca vitripennis TaxID=197043 RepID=UPI001EECA3FA|nr:uncharacterized protein LOC124373673 [Homalodisca vitripennis]
MLEELTMDKKPSNRSVQVPSKGTGTENKKDVSKQFSKTSRRREPANSNGYRSDQNRKPAPQKGKTMDKRPRPRGQLYGGGKESAQVEECEAELGFFVLDWQQETESESLVELSLRSERGDGPAQSPAEPPVWSPLAHVHTKAQVQQGTFLASQLPIRCESKC